MSCYNQVNTKDKLESSDYVIVEDRCRDRGVKASFFLQSLVDDNSTGSEPLTLTLDGGVLTVSLRMRDSTVYTAQVTIS